MSKTQKEAGASDNPGQKKEAGPLKRSPWRLTDYWPPGSRDPQLVGSSAPESKSCTTSKKRTYE